MESFKILLDKYKGNLDDKKIIVKNYLTINTIWFSII